jgi:hypothetical protein
VRRIITENGVDATNAQWFWAPSADIVGWIFCWALVE